MTRLVLLLLLMAVCAVLVGSTTSAVVEQTAAPARHFAARAERSEWRRAMVSDVTPESIPPLLPTTTVAERVHAPPGGIWACIRRLESGDDYHNKRNPTHRGAYQFAFATWRSVGGVGDPADASPSEQDYRAQLLQARSGWGQWVTARRCGA